MHYIHEDPNITQRNLSKKTGISIGKVNYCLKSLVEIGFIKMVNFKNSNKKMSYSYLITPKGVREKVAITKQFIVKKQQEYDKLKSYIKK